MKKNQKKSYKGFRFPLGFFVLFEENSKEKKLIFGKVDPLYKQIFEIYEYNNEGIFLMNPKKITIESD